LSADSSSFDLTSGDPEEGTLTLESLYRREVSFVWRTLARLGIPEADRKDLTQEVFIVAQRRWSTLRDSAAARPWLYGICRRLAARYRRKAFRRRERAVPDLPEVGNHGVGPEEAACEREARAVLDTILGRMSLDQRVVFVMFEIDEVSTPDIARDVGCPLGTVYSRLSAARRVFRRELERLEAKRRREG
jgi:RNA polymerase sigma-70 factor (ECF subfamily)